MKNTLLLFTILLLCSCKDNELQKFNVSSEKWVKELDRYSNSLIDQNELPGLVVMVKKGDKQIFHKYHHKLGLNFADIGDDYFEEGYKVKAREYYEKSKFIFEYN